MTSPLSKEPAQVSGSLDIAGIRALVDRYRDEVFSFARIKYREYSTLTAALEDHPESAALAAKTDLLSAIDTLGAALSTAIAERDEARKDFASTVTPEASGDVRTLINSMGFYWREYSRLLSALHPDTDLAHGRAAHAEASLLVAIAYLESQLASSVERLKEMEADSARFEYAAAHYIGGGFDHGDDGNRTAIYIEVPRKARIGADFRRAIDHAIAEEKASLGVREP